MQKAKAAYENLTTAQRGVLLTELIKIYNQNQSPQTLMPILQCLMDRTVVGVPMRVSEEDMKLLEASRAKQEKAPAKISMKTVVLKTPEGVNYLPVFSTRGEVPQEFFEKYYWLQMPFKECAKLVKSMEQVDQIIINTFTQRLVLPEETLDGIIMVDGLRPADDTK